MSVYSHILFTFGATVAAWASWALVIVYINPEQSGGWGVPLFYFTLFLSLFGTLTVIGFVARSIVKLRKRSVDYKTMTAIRQAFLWSLALIVALFLQSQGLLQWWLFVIIILIFGAIEFFALTTQHNPTES